MRKKNQKKNDQIEFNTILIGKKKSKNLIRWIKLKTIKALTKEQRKERNNQK